jgi:hypothetical protein
MTSFIDKPKTQSLYVNTDATEHYVIQKSEEDGVKDLRALTATSSVEESWIFVSGTDQKNNPISLWYEIGENETSESIAFLGSAPPSVLKDLERRGVKISSWSLYHFHPADGNKFQTETFSTPDYEAVDFFTGSGAHQKWDVPQATHKIITSNGLWSLSLTKQHPVGTKDADAYFDVLLDRMSRIEDLRLNGAMLCVAENKCTPDYQTIADLISSEWISVTFTAFQ